MGFYGIPRCWECMRKLGLSGDNKEYLGWMRLGHRELCIDCLADPEPQFDYIQFNIEGRGTRTHAGHSPYIDLANLEDVDDFLDEPSPEWVDAHLRCLDVAYGWGRKSYWRQKP